jgi:L-alanine-DL-glutamate epimerase-like enolase superfamily enzyme/D-alanine-D-alanine ligase-like ATP-grasp enzyme
MRIESAQAFQYTMPLRNPFSTARHTTTRSTNYLIRLSSEQHSGIGEAATRGSKLTGDSRKLNGAVIEAMLVFLQGRELACDNRQAALCSIAETYRELQAIAQSFATRSNRHKPFRGLLSGVEIALLDLAARQLGLTVSQLLGQQREQVAATATTSGSSQPLERLAARFQQQASVYRAYRCKGEGDTALNLQRLGAMREANRQSGTHLAYWLDLNEALTPESATALVEELIAWMQAQPHPQQRLILEQPVAKRHFRALCELQALVDRRLPTEAGRLAIMADESLWDLEDLKRLLAAGGVGALNIKVPKAGGLLPALAIAEHAREACPDALVYIGGMIGTSDVSGRAIYQLARALPRLDHCTTTPARNVEANLASQPLAFAAAASRHLALGDAPGLGTVIDENVLEHYLVERYPSAPASEPSSQSARYHHPELLLLGQKALDSALMERAILQAGLTSERRSATRLRVKSPRGRILARISWSLDLALGKEPRHICRHKNEAKHHMAKAGVPVAEGQDFPVDEKEQACAYARELGWPVVVKPVVGTGGAGVTAGIRTEEELRWALARVAESERVVARNIGRVLVERHVDGQELRIFVANGAAVAAVYRMAPHVVGDGVHSVQMLIQRKNEQRRSNPRLKNSPLKVNEATEMQLSRQGLDLESIPEPGQQVRLSSVNSISQGADTANVLQEVHPSVLDAAVRAVAAVPGLKRAGVDIIVADYTQPLEPDQSCVCELNTSPSLAAATFPVEGPSSSVADAFLRCMLKGRKVKLRRQELGARCSLRLQVQSQLSEAETARLLSYCYQHGLEGEGVNATASTTLYLVGACDALLTLPANVMGMMANRSAPPSLVSRLLDDVRCAERIEALRGGELGEGETRFTLGEMPAPRAIEAPAREVGEAIASRAGLLKGLTGWLKGE